MSFLTKEFLTSPEGQNQLKALDDSIVLWRKREAGLHGALYGIRCPLCIFNLKEEVEEWREESDCTRCIIGIDTGDENCDKTPYYEVEKCNVQDCKLMLDWLVNLKKRANDCINS